MTDRHTDTHTDTHTHKGARRQAAPFRCARSFDFLCVWLTLPTDFRSAFDLPLCWCALCALCVCVCVLVCQCVGVWWCPSAAYVRRLSDSMRLPQQARQAGPSHSFAALLCAAFVCATATARATATALVAPWNECVFNEQWNPWHIRRASLPVCLSDCPSICLFVCLSAGLTAASAFSFCIFHLIYFLLHCSPLFFGPVPLQLQLELQLLPPWPDIRFE